MIAITFSNAITSLTRVFSSQCRLRQLLESSTVVLAMLLFAPVMDLPSSFAVAQTQMQLNKKLATSIRRRRGNE